MLMRLGLFAFGITLLGAVALAFGLWGSHDRPGVWWPAEVVSVLTTGSVFAWAAHVSRSVGLR